MYNIISIRELFSVFNYIKPKESENVLEKALFVNEISPRSFGENNVVFLDL